MSRWAGWGVLVLMVTAGCDTVFDFTRVPDAAPDARVCPPPSGAPADDPDGDGVINEVDNCAAVSNALQNDEDLDCFGDACDPCPWIPDAATADADGDGLPDLCDDARGVRSTLFFDGFADPQLTQTSFDTGPTWSVAGGQLSAPAAPFAWAGVKAIAATSGSVDLTFRVPTATLDAGGDFLVGAFALMHNGPDPTTHAGFVIGLARESGKDWVRIIHISFGVFDGPPTQRQLVDERLRPVLLDDGAIRLHVAAAGAGMSPGAVTATLWIRGTPYDVTFTNPNPAGGDYFGAFARDTAATFDYLALVTDVP